MHKVPILSAVLLTAATPVSAQVTLDLHALQALPDRPAASHPARRVPPPVASTGPATAKASAPVPDTTASMPPPAVPAAPQPSLPDSVPTTASIAPIEPPAGAPPPPPPPISDKAATAAAPTTSGLRLTFAPDAADLSPESASSIKDLAAAAPSGDATTFNVQAYAPGKSDDPSTARRMSLSRAMAVRGALVADGVPSARIFVRAMGEQYGDGPPNRVDISVTGTNTPGDTAAAK